ncbi:hypothetical protein [Nitratifractor sp.]
MNLKPRALAFLISFLLGAAWALTIVGALSALFAYRPLGVPAMLFHAFLWAVPGLVSVLLLEYILAGFRRNEELKRQSELLERILQKLEAPSESR